MIYCIEILFRYQAITDMVTKATRPGTFVVVVDIGTVPSSQEWLRKATYLFDTSGRIDAVIAQTDQPNTGVTLQPVPFMPANAQILQVASSVTPRTTNIHFDSSGPSKKLSFQCRQCAVHRGSICRPGRP